MLLRCLLYQSLLHGYYNSRYLVQPHYRETGTRPRRTWDFSRVPDTHKVFLTRHPEAFGLLLNDLKKTPAHAFWTASFRHCDRSHSSWSPQTQTAQILKAEGDPHTSSQDCLKHCLWLTLSSTWDASSLMYKKPWDTPTISTHVHAHTLVYTHTHIHIDKCTYICIFKYICIFTHIHTLNTVHTHISKPSSLESNRPSQTQRTGHSPLRSTHISAHLLVTWLQRKDLPFLSLFLAYEITLTPTLLGGLSNFTS